MLERLAKAEKMGSVPIDPTRGDAVEQIKTLRGRERKGAAYQDEDPLGGVGCGIDAIGFQMCDPGSLAGENPD